MIIEVEYTEIYYWAPAQTKPTACQANKSKVCNCFQTLLQWLDFPGWANKHKAQLEKTTKPPVQPWAPLSSIDMLGVNFVYCMCRLLDSTICKTNHTFPKCITLSDFIITLLPLNNPDDPHLQAAAGSWWGIWGNVGISWPVRLHCIVLT